MSLIVATIPEDAAQLPAWLERQLAGLQLDRLVAELAGVPVEIVAEDGSVLSSEEPDEQTSA